MNPTHWSAHVKHVVIVLILAGGVVLAIDLRGKYETAIADRMAKRDEQIAKNQASVKQSQGVIDQSQKTITAADLDLASKLATIQAQLAQKPDSLQTQMMIRQMLPGIQATSTTDAAGNKFISVPDTQDNRDKINQASGAYQSCRFSLDDCQKARQQYETVIIPEKDKQISAQQDTIKLQSKDITDLRKMQVPRWTALLGVGKAQGTNLRDANSYQPFLGIDYRITSRFGVFAAAQNKQGAVGISWHFGHTK